MHTPATCLPACLLVRLLCPGCCTPCHLPFCLFAGQAIVPRLLCPGYCTPRNLPAFRAVSCPGYSAQATEHPASLPACLFAGQATLPRLLHTLPLACLPFCWPVYSAQAIAYPADCLPDRLLATLLSPANPAALLPACQRAGKAVLPRLLSPGYCTPCHLPVTCPGYSAMATEHPASCLPVCWPGYSAQANAHPATCLPARFLASLLCPANSAA